MAERLEIGEAALDKLTRAPDGIVEGRINGSIFSARVAIPDYRANIARHYGCGAGGKLDEICRKTQIPFGFKSFGLIITFDKPIALALHGTDMTLDDGAREMVARFGPLIVRNARLAATGPVEEQRNIFPDLNFHFDRGANQATQYTLFSRDPSDPVHRQPRASSTVFVANIVAHLQYAREQANRPEEEEWRSRYNLFQDEPIRECIGSTVVEHAWDAPEGAGEISLLYNRTVLHASYYRKRGLKGYPIGVRYLK